MWRLKISGRADEGAAKSGLQEVCGLEEFGGACDRRESKFTFRFLGGRYGHSKFQGGLVTEHCLSFEALDVGGDDRSISHAVLLHRVRHRKGREECLVGGDRHVVRQEKILNRIDVFGGLRFDHRRHGGTHVGGMDGGAEQGCSGKDAEKLHGRKGFKNFWGFRNTR